MQNKIKQRLKVLATGIGIVFFGRGCWHFLDEVSLPHNPLLGSILCIIIIGLITVLWVNYDKFKPIPSVLNYYKPI
jgi:hypothetical protein